METEINDSGTDSKYSEGELKIIRINNLQRIINQCNLNPLGKDANGMYNYLLMFNAINSHFAEIHSKLSTDERKEGLEAQKEIRNFLKQHILFQKRTNDHYKTIYLITTPKMEELLEGLQEWDLIVRDWAEKHKFGSSNHKEVKRI